MSRPRGPIRIGVHLRMRPDIVEAMEETCEELTISRNKLAEVAIEDYLRRLQIPSRTPMETATAES